jgi:hypothetical protein
LHLWHARATRDLRAGFVDLDALVGENCSSSGLAITGGEFNSLGSIFEAGFRRGASVRVDIKVTPLSEMKVQGTRPEE